MSHRRRLHTGRPPPATSVSFPLFLSFFSFLLSFFSSSLFPVCPRLSSPPSGAGLFIVEHKSHVMSKHYPRAYLSNGDSELVVFEEAWSPFAVGSDGIFSCKNAAEKVSKEPINAADFHLLLARLIEGFDEMESSETKLELLAEMMLFIYLITILEADFLPRNQAFLANSLWIPLRESFLNKLLVSRMVNYKGLVKDCLHVISIPFTPMDHDSESFDTTSSKLSETSDLALDLSFPEVQKHACEAVQKLLVMMMELDSSRRKADTQNLTTRIDGQRIAVVDLILDELSYNKDMISPFLQAFDEPELKMEIVSQFLQKYTAKPSTRNRRNHIKFHYMLPYDGRG